MQSVVKLHPRITTWRKLMPAMCLGHVSRPCVPHRLTDYYMYDMAPPASWFARQSRSTRTAGPFKMSCSSSEFDPSDYMWGNYKYEEWSSKRLSQNRTCTRRAWCSTEFKKGATWDTNHQAPAQVRQQCCAVHLLSCRHADREPRRGLRGIRHRAKLVSGATTDIELYVC